MSDARSQLSPEKRAALDAELRAMLRDSVVEDAIVRFIGQILAEARALTKEQKPDGEQ